MFKYDGPIFRFLSRALDLILLNVVWTICCLPVVTIGPATTALYTVMFKMKEDKDDNVLKLFFVAFKDNFKQSFLTTLILIPVGVILYLDYRVMYFDETFSADYLKGFFWVILVILFAFIGWVFPLEAKFENTLGAMLKNTWLMMIRHLPATLVITLLNISPVLILYFAPEFTVSYLTLFWVFFGFALIAFANSQLLYNVFTQYFPKEETEEEAEEN